MESHHKPNSKLSINVANKQRIHYKIKVTKVTRKRKPEKPSTIGIFTTDFYRTVVDSFSVGKHRNLFPWVEPS